jgi:hypothetical protein
LTAKSTVVLHLLTESVEQSEDELRALIGDRGALCLLAQKDDRLLIDFLREL